MGDLTTKSTDDRAEIYVQEQSPGVWIVMGTANGVKGKMPPRAFPVLRLDAKKGAADTFLQAGTKFTGLPEYVANRLKSHGWTCVSLEAMAGNLKA